MKNNLSISFPLFLLVISTLWLATGCGPEVATKMETKGTALGKMNEIVVIADDILWESAVGDTFRFYFESAYPILPAPEPLFDIRHFNPNDLKVQPIRKELRTYTILADMNDLDSPTTQMVLRDMGKEKFERAEEGKISFSSVGKDKWARGQLLVYLLGKGHEGIQKSIVDNFSAVAKRINQHDKKQLSAGMYVDRVNLGLTEKLKTNFGIDFKVPGDFKTAVSDEENNVLWIRKNTKKADLNVVIKNIPYKDQKQLSKGNIVAMRDDFGRTYVTADSPNDVMAVDSMHLPVYEYSTKIDGRYSKELRGIWEMTESFSGGPFTTYVIVNEGRKELIFVDVFILGPGSKKRDLMMQLNHMVKSSKIVS